LKNGGEDGKGSELRERVFEFACAVLELHRLIYRREPSLRNASFQAADAAGSVGANLEEADAAQSRADFISKCTISLKEAREARYWLRALARVLKEERQIAPLIGEATEIVAILTAIVKKTRGNS
jgi:four helix bundle protein